MGAKIQSGGTKANGSGGNPESPAVVIHSPTGVCMVCSASLILREAPAGDPNTVMIDVALIIFDRQWRGAVRFKAGLPSRCGARNGALGLQAGHTPTVSRDLIVLPSHGLSPAATLLAVGCSDSRGRCLAGWNNAKPVAGASMPSKSPRRAAFISLRGTPRWRASLQTSGSWSTGVHPPARRQRTGWTHEVEERRRKARVRSHARLAAAWLYACERSGSKNQCPVPL